MNKLVFKKVKMSWLRGSRFLKPARLFCSLCLLLSACVPIVRTEYLSPSWYGTLLDIKTGEPLIGVEVSDLYSQLTVTTDNHGYFELAPVISQFSFKLPVASMASYYQIEFALPERKLRISGYRLAVTVEPSKFDLGVFTVDTSINSAEFFLEAPLLEDLPLKERSKMVQLPNSLIENCGAPLQDAISLSKAARLYKRLVNTKQNLGDQIITEKDLALSYHWAEEAWNNASNLCFRGDYEQKNVFYSYSKLFQQEAQPYLKNTSPYNQTEN
jgi:hypothetical protein